MATRRKRQRKIAPSVKVLIDKYAVRGHSASQIRLELQGANVPPDLIPQLHTIQRAVRDVMPQDHSGPWAAQLGNGEQAVLILPVLARLIEESHGQRTHLTTAEAKWVVSIRLIAPDLDPFDVFLIARAYMNRERKEMPTIDLDAFFAFAPWRSEEASRRYRKAVWQGWVARIPLVESLVKGGLGPGPDVMGPQQTERYLSSLKEGKEDDDEERK